MRPRRIRCGLATALLTVSLAGCSATPANRGDPGGAGLAATVGDVELLNVLIVAEEEGGPGILCGMGTNSSDQVRQVDIRLPSGAGTTMTLPAGGTADLGCQGPDPVILDEVGAPPGALAEVTFSTQGGESVDDVPVLYPYSETPYGTLAPPGVTPEPTRGSGSPGG